jgi:ribonucleoside-diphosphate reductase alpha chain
MKSVQLKSVSTGVSDIPLQDASLDIWDTKYRLKRKDGVAVDESIDGTYQRVAQALAEVEITPEKQAHWNEQFLWALRHGAIPAGRIISNAGALEHKPATSTINCTVSGTIQDSRVPMYPAPVPIPRVRCRLWISTTRCVSPCHPRVAGVAPRWLPSM